MRFRVTVRTNKVGSEIEDEVEIDDEDLEGLDEADRAKAIEEACRETAFSWVDWAWEPIEG